MMYIFYARKLNISTHACTVRRIISRIADRFFVQDGEKEENKKKWVGAGRTTTKRVETTPHPYTCREVELKNNESSLLLDYNIDGLGWRGVAQAASLVFFYCIRLQYRPLLRKLRLRKSAWAWGFRGEVCGLRGDCHTKSYIIDGDDL